jgi:hypothetical protein
MQAEIEVLKANLTVLQERREREHGRIAKSWLTPATQQLPYAGLLA